MICVSPMNVSSLLSLCAYAFRRYAMPFSVGNVSKAPSILASNAPASLDTLVTVLARTVQTLPFSERITADSSLPSCQVISTSKPPLARRPLMLPSGQDSGSAGSRLISPE